MRFIDLATAKLVVLFGLAALLAGTSAGCQCCAWTERFMDCVDCVSDHEGRAEVLYHPGYDLTRIGRANWPWRWCRRCRNSPGFVYETPVTHRVMARMHAEEHPPDEDPPAMAPPPLPDDLWSEPDSSMESGEEDIGLYPFGPLFSSENEASPAPPVESAPGLLPDDSLPGDSLRRDSDSAEAREIEPTPAVSDSQTARERERQARDEALMNSSGVVRLFDDGDAGGSSPGITVHSVDQSEFGPVSMESWLSDRPLGAAGVETASAESSDDAATTASETQVPAWAAAAQREVNDQPDVDVLPSSGSSHDSASQQAERAEWWEAKPGVPSNQPGISPTSTSASDDVFGPAPFAEWQSAPE